MLILTRRVGETLMIGDDVTVTVLGVKGNQVRIGVNAPGMSQCTVKKFTRGSGTRRHRQANPPISTAPMAAVTATVICEAVQRPHLYARTYCSYTSPEASIRCSPLSR